MAITSEDSTNYKVTQGDTFRLKVTYTDPAGSPISLEGYTIRAEVKDRPGGKVLCAYSELGDGVLVQDPATGVIEIEFSPAKTRKFYVPKAAYQVQITDQYGSKSTLVQGWFVVNPGVID